jgi:pimeloyl-ACP methyl ester carboxylesterase
VTTNNNWSRTTLKVDASPAAGISPSAGESLIWLHGWGYDKKAFARIASLFKSYGDNQLYDLPGFGSTPMLHKGVGTSDYAAALAEQLDTSKRYTIIGHSYGGRVAVQLAANYPDLVKAIVLVGGAGLPVKRSVSFKAKAFLLRMLGRLARLSDAVFGSKFRAAYVARFGSKDYRDAGEMRATLVSAVNENLSNSARKIACPTLLLYGSDDRDTPCAIGRQYERLIPVSRFTELKGYDHHDILTRGAYQCEALIKSFLKDINHD